MTNVPTRRARRADHFYSEEGLKEFVKYLDATRGTPISSTRSSTSTRRRTAFRWKWPCSTTIRSRRTSTPYVNNINTIEGGTHLTGFRRALTRTLKKYAEDSGMLTKLKFDINGDDFREDLRPSYR